MKTMLPSSKLLPATIIAIAAVAAFKIASLAVSVPSPGALRAETAQVLAMAGSAAGITQAHAAAADHLSPPPSNPQPPKPQSPAPKPSNPMPAQPVSAPPVAAPPVSAAPRPAASHEAPAHEASSREAPRPPAGGEPANLADAVHAAPTPPPIAAPAPSQAAPKPEAEAKAGTDIPAETPPAVSAGAAAPDSLKLRLGQTEDRERQLTQRESMLDAADARLQARVGELVALQLRLQALDAARKERDEANWAGLVKMYEGMRPRDAAAIFNALDKAVLLEILDRMKPAKAGPLIAAMDAEKARQVTADLANKRIQTTTVSN